MEACFTVTALILPNEEVSIDGRLEIGSVLHRGSVPALPKLADPMTSYSTGRSLLVLFLLLSTWLGHASEQRYIRREQSCLS